MHQEIIDTLKERYTRDIRKQLIKTILKDEKSKDKKAKESSYILIKQIFSYVIGEVSWSMSENTNSWDDTPLKIMQEVFPKIETTQWFKEQHISVKNSVNLTGDFK